MTNDTTATDRDVATDGGTTYKILGELDDAGGIGLFGRNTAASGTTYGIWGEVDSPDGYGLYTPDDAKVDGAVEVARLTGSLTGGEELTDLVGDNLSIEDGTLTASSGGGGSWVDDDDDGLLEPGDGYDGVDLSGSAAGTVVTPTVESTGSLTLETDGERALELGTPDEDALGYPAGANVVAGYPGNSIEDGAVGATIGGGGNSYAENEVSDEYGTVGGGIGNRAGDDDGDATSARYATVGGGQDNMASGWLSTVAGGHDNEAGDDLATVGGGSQNVASDHAATVAGGYLHTASGDYATVGGGRDNAASGTNATVGGGAFNEANDDNATISGGKDHTASGQYATVSGGQGNVVDSHRATVGGGYNNTASDSYATIGGGSQNTASDSYATIGGGRNNTAGGFQSTVAGGRDNVADGNYSFAVGRKANANHSGSVVFGDSSDTAISSSGGDKAIFQQRVDIGGGGLGGVRLLIEGDSADDDYLLRVRDNKSTKLAVHDNGGTSIGTLNSPPSDGLRVNGDFEVTGEKDFVQAVETDDGPKEVLYASTEAGEARTEASGVARLADGRAEIALPDHFGWVTSEEEPLVVQTTPYTVDSAGLAVVERSTDRIVVEDLDGDGDYEFAYTVKGVREGYENRRVVREPSTSDSEERPSPADD